MQKRRQRKLPPLFLFLSLAAGAVTAAAAGSATATVGAADAFLTLLFGSVNESYSQTQNQGHNTNDNKIHRTHRLFPSCTKLGLDAAVGTAAQTSQHNHEPHHK